MTDAAADDLNRYVSTQRFSIGVPRQFRIAADGRSALFLRAPDGKNPVSSLWRQSLGGTFEPVELANPEVLSAEPERVSDQDSVLQRRTRVAGSGILSYSATDDLTAITFTLGGRLFAGSAAGDFRDLQAGEGASGAAMNPRGTSVAYVRDGAVYLAGLQEPQHELLAGGDGENVSWGVLDLISAEEIGLTRGLWWTPDGQRLLVLRVDSTDVGEWLFTDLADPLAQPEKIRYPQAGTANSATSLHIVSLDGEKVRVDLDAERYPYLVAVVFLAERPGVLVQSRDQREMAFFSIDETTGRATELYRDSAQHWLDIVNGAPDQLDAQLVRVVEVDDSRRLMIGESIVTPPELQVRAIGGVYAGTVIFTASTDSRETHVWRGHPDGTLQVLTKGPRVHSVSVSPGGFAVVSDSIDQVKPEARITTDAGESDVPVVSLEPDRPPVPVFRSVTDRNLHCAMVFPRTSRSDEPLPVVLDPYGGPGAQRVTMNARSYCAAQWLADQGFAVVIADGRGTPGRGLRWEHSLDGDFASAAVDDQVAALQAVAAHEPRLDLTRVAIRGWSFGGYLALQVGMRHPELIKAVVAGAPVTDWTLYDTHYTERFLGTPQQNPEAYRRSAVHAATAEGPRPALLFIHGLNDDNVHPANTVQLSSALLRAGWDHQAMYLPQAHHGVTDPAASAAVLRAEARFLIRELHGRG